MPQTRGFKGAENAFSGLVESGHEFPLVHDVLNQAQRLILVAKDFHSDVVSAVLWLRDYEVDVKCIRLRSFVDDDGDLFITPDVIIPLPEAKDYIERKEVKQKHGKQTMPGSFSMEKGNFDLAELETRLKATLSRPTVLI